MQMKVRGMNRALGGLLPDNPAGAEFVSVGPVADKILCIVGGYIVKNVVVNFPGNAAKFIIGSHPEFSITATGSS